MMSMDIKREAWLIEYDLDKYILHSRRQQAVKLGSDARIDGQGDLIGAG